MDESERCECCGRVAATEADWSALHAHECGDGCQFGADLCWGIGANCESTPPGDLMAEIRRLRGERDEARRQRDEARRELCYEFSGADISEEGVASRRGWGYLYDSRLPDSKPERAVAGSIQGDLGMRWSLVVDQFGDQWHWTAVLHSTDVDPTSLPAGVESGVFVGPEVPARKILEDVKGRWDREGDQ